MAALPVTEINPDISHSLYEIISKCLQKNPDERFESGKALSDALKALVSKEETIVVQSYKRSTPMKWDLFISHASEDKADVARPLASLLQQHGLNVWLDEHELILGDSLRRKIDDGLAQSSWGVVILSPTFLEKEWPQAELDALLSKELNGQRVILPVWHEISATELSRKSPILASRLAVDTSKGLGAVTSAIFRAVQDGNNARASAETPIPDPVQDWWFNTTVSDLCRRLRDNPQQFYEQRVGQYSLKQFIGMGGTGGVFRATYVPFGRIVALKLFFPLESQLENITRATERAVRGLGSLRHPAIVDLLDFGYVSGLNGRTSYLAYEFVDGCSLHEWSYSIRDDDHSVRRRLNVAVEIAKALHASHNCKFTGNLGFEEYGVLHGDLKPSNILVNDKDSPKLLDFMVPDIQNLLKIHENRDTYWKKNVNGQYLYEDLRTTAFGTPGYMPPEQELDGIVTPASDIYALGMTFLRHFWPVTKRPGFDVVAVGKAKIGQGDGIENEIACLVTDMTASQPSNRIQTMQEIVERLMSIVDRLGDMQVRNNT